MKQAFEVPDAIQWHEGMRLAPQHFQQLAVRQEALLSYHMATVLPFMWGVQLFKVDPIQLTKGLFRLLELEAVMPDGLRVSVSPEDGFDLEADLAACSERLMQGPMRVYLAVPARGIKDDEVGRSGLQRYDSVDGRPVADDNTGEQPIAIPRLRPRLSLLLDEVPPPKYVSIPIAEVLIENDSFGLTDFIRPALSAPLREPLGQLCSAVSKSLREKAYFLAEQAKAATSIAQGSVTADAQNAIRSLVAGLPQLEALLYADGVHPYWLYVALCNISGHLAALGPGSVPPLFDPYDHNDLRASFARVLDYIERLLERVQQSYRVVSFDYLTDRFALTVENALKGDKLLLGLRGRPGTADKDLIAWMDNAIIGSSTRMQAMLEKRIRGPARSCVEQDETLGVVPRRGVALFSVPFDKAYLEESGVLQVFNPSDPGGAKRPAEIVLYLPN